MSNEKQQIEEMAKVLCKHFGTNKCEDCWNYNMCPASRNAEKFYNAGYRKYSEVIDEFVKRLLDAFPESNRDNHCPAIYYDDYRYIIEEIAEKMKGGAE